MSEAATNIVEMPRKANHFRMVKAMEMEMSTHYSPEQIANACNITVGTLRKWQRDPYYKAEYQARYDRIMARHAELMKPHTQRFDEHILKALELQEEVIDQAREIVKGEDVSMRDLKDAQTIVESIYAHDPRRRHTKTTRQENKTEHEHNINTSGIKQIVQEGHMMVQAGVVEMLRKQEAIPVLAHEVEEDEGEDETLQTNSE